MLYKMSRTILFITILASISSSAIAQSRLSFGFKAGLNSSTFSGPVDENESYSNNTGFHIGMIFRYRITDNFGLRGEFMYNQRGGQYRYDGPSSFALKRPNGTSLLISGNREMDINVSSNYLDFPFTVYNRFGPIEIHAGVNFGILAGALGGGQLKFNGTQPAATPFTANIDHRYHADELGEAIAINTEEVTVGNEVFNVPRQLGAYYEYNSKDGGRYRLLDVGIVGGVSYFINEGLYLGLRGYYGLLDVTNPKMDVIYDRFSNNAPSIRDDFDRQISYQLSLGFSF